VRPGLRLAASGVALLGLLAACGTDTTTPPASKPAESRVQVDTPALRRAKAAAGIADCAPGAARTAAAQHPLPAVTLACLGGGPDVRLDRLRGPLVVNLFAQWCGPCRQELPYYQQLHEKAAGKVQVLGVDYLDTQPGMALQLARQTGVKYPLLADPAGRLRTAFRVRGLPGVVLVGADGSVKDVEFEVMRSYGQLRGLVQDRLGVRVPR
jgi:thiol-disulfide isomerase/thioredoxin